MNMCSNYAADFETATLKSNVELLRKNHGKDFDTLSNRVSKVLERLMTLARHLGGRI